MKQIHTIAISSSFLLILAACGGLAVNKTPGCGAEQTLNLVKEIAQEELIETYEIEATSLILTNVATTAYDKEIDVHSCAATLEVEYKHYSIFDNSVSLEDLSRNITFNVYTLATDPTKFLVNVEGLWSMEFEPMDDFEPMEMEPMEFEPMEFELDF